MPGSPPTATATAEPRGLSVRQHQHQHQHPHQGQHPYEGQSQNERQHAPVNEPEWEAAPPAAIRGRGAAENPASRFDRLRYEPEPPTRTRTGTGTHVADNAADNAADDAANDAANNAANNTAANTAARADSGSEPPPRTVYLRDPSRTALAYNKSPDINFNASLNPYRGCEHGCVYCYARPTHEYLGFSAGLDFETRILVKEDAPELLRRELAARRWKPQVVGLSGVTDPYQPIERRIELTRRCLQVFAEFRNPVQIITKNGLVARDADLLAELAAHEAASVCLSVTTLDAELHHIMEPRTSHPANRLKAIEALAKAGVPVGVMVAPIIPAINDHEIPAILAAAANAGAGYAGHVVLRLPHGVKDLFSAWLLRHFPERRGKVLNKLRSLRSGRLNDPAFGSRMKGGGVFADQIHDLFEIWRSKTGIGAGGPTLSTAAFRPPGDAQLHLF